MDYLALSIFGSVLAIGATTIVCFRLWVKERNKMTPKIFLEKMQETISLFDWIKSMKNMFGDKDTSTEDKAS